MKKSAFKILPLLYLLVLTNNVFSANARKTKPDTTKCIEINARIYDLTMKGGAYKVELLRSRSKVDATFMVEKESFKFILKKSEHYAIRISKDNIIIRQISLFTKNPVRDVEAGYFHFHTDLSFDYDPDDSGFPIGIITIDGKVKSTGTNENGLPTGSTITIK